MSDPMIKLTGPGPRAFYVNAFAVDMVEPTGIYFGSPLRSIVHVAGQVRKCCEDVDEVLRLVEDAKTDARAVTHD